MTPILQASDAKLQRVIGRFAPSPTGELHLGSLTTAVASYCHIKSLQATNPSTNKSTTYNPTTYNPTTYKPNIHNPTTPNSHRHLTKWLLRIEDTDTQRCKPEFSEQILRDLSALGLYWDDAVVYQSQRTSLYNQVINEVLTPFVYACDCSRKDLQSFAIYPRNCVNKSLNQLKHKLRICLPDEQISFIDGIQGKQWQNPQASLGDMVIRRDKNSQNIINYILAVTIDDRLQGVTHIMRGLDILPMTSAQIAINNMLDSSTGSDSGLNLYEKYTRYSLDRELGREVEGQPPQKLANMAWYHLPLVMNEQGQKLSKQNLAKPIDTSTEKSCSQLLATALKFLNQATVEMDKPELMLSQAIEQWDNELIQLTS